MTGRETREPGRLRVCVRRRRRRRLTTHDFFLLLTPSMGDGVLFFFVTVWCWMTDCLLVDRNLTPFPVNLASIVSQCVHVISPTYPPTPTTEV